MPKQPKKYGDMVRRARELMPQRLGYDERWTQAQLAAVLGVEANYIAMVERSEREPSKLFQRALDFAMQMAEAGLDPRAPAVW